MKQALDTLITKLREDTGRALACALQVQSRVCGALHYARDRWDGMGWNGCDGSNARLCSCRLVLCLCDGSRVGLAAARRRGA